MLFKIFTELLLIFNAIIWLQAAQINGKYWTNFKLILFQSFFVAFTSGRKKSQQKKTVADTMNGLDFGRNVQQIDDGDDRELDGNLAETNDPNSRLMERIRQKIKF